MAKGQLATVNKVEFYFGVLVGGVHVALEGSSNKKAKGLGANFSRALATHHHVMIRYK